MKRILLQCLRQPWLNTPYNGDRGGFYFYPHVKASTYLISYQAELHMWPWKGYILTYGTWAFAVLVFISAQGCNINRWTDLKSLQLLNPVHFISTWSCPQHITNCSSCLYPSSLLGWEIFPLFVYPELLRRCHRGPCAKSCLCRFQHVSAFCAAQPTRQRVGLAEREGRQNVKGSGRFPQ